MTFPVPGNRPSVALPGRRRLRTYAFDPMSTRLSGRWLEVDVPYERWLRPGPSGELVQVVDVDHARGLWYAPLDLDDPAVLARGGLTPSELDPRTHQQVVYAVAMSVLERFERFMGRRFRWRAGERLVLVPHAFEGRNAFFDPTRGAVFFGHYPADRDDPGANLPGQRMFTCLSNDVVAHEVTHAVVHRLRPHYSEATNPDVVAFHEAAADLMALFLHFAYRDVVVAAVSDARGDLHEGEGLFDLAREFGLSTGRGAALRSAVMTRPDGPAAPLPEEPHARGAVFVAGVFDAFLESYQHGIADLLRIATGGTGVLPAGHLHPDLVGRVATEAVKHADRLLGMVVRAFDHLPVVDVELGDVVRAIVTADRLLYPDDAGLLRARLVECLRRRGVFPDVSSLVDDALTWPGPTTGLVLGGDPCHQVDLRVIVDAATRDLDTDGVAGSLAAPGEELGDEVADEAGRLFAGQLLGWARGHALELGLSGRHKVAIGGFHVSYRLAADQQPRPLVVVQLHQRRKDLEQLLGEDGVPEHLRTRLRAGTTVVAGADGRIDHLVTKPLPLTEEELADVPPALQRSVTAYQAEGAKRLTRLLGAQARFAAADPLAPWLSAPAASRLTFAHLHATVPGALTGTVT